MERIFLRSKSIRKCHPFQVRAYDCLKMNAHLPFVRECFLVHKSCNRHFENLRFLEIGAGSDLKKVAEAIGDRDIISCIRYSPVALKSDDKYAIYGKMKNAIEAFGSDKNLCFSCVGIDANTDHDEVRSYLEAFSLLKNDITDNFSKGI